MMFKALTLALSILSYMAIAEQASVDVNLQQKKYTNMINKAKEPQRSGPRGTYTHNDHFKKHHRISIDLRSNTELTELKKNGLVLKNK